MKRTKTSLLAFLLLAPWWLLGCSMEASIASLQGIAPVTLFEKNQLSGFVSSSAQNQVTANGYVVQSSSGAFSNKIEETTTGGYKVYISVQGNIVSDQR